MFPRVIDPDVFPPCVARFSVAIPAALSPPAAASAGTDLPAELKNATVRRKLQFLAGRICARGAIEGLAPGAPVGTVPQDADGCPIWPQGLVGSISHADTFATAAAARRSDARGLGVDVEPVMSRAAAAEVARLVAREDETRRVVGPAGLGPLETLTLVFSAKESLFKALYPETRKPFDYLDCALARLDRGERRFAIRFGPPFDAAFGAAEFAGRYEFAEGSVRTGVLIPPA